MEHGTEMIDRPTEDDSVQNNVAINQDMMSASSPTEKE